MVRFLVTVEGKEGLWEVVSQCWGRDRIAGVLKSIWRVRKEHERL